MEEEVNNFADNEYNDGFIIDEEVTKHLKTAYKWARFIAISSFIVLGIYFIFLIFNTREISFSIGNIYGIGSMFALLGVLLFIILLFLVFYHLMRFANIVKKALEINDIIEFNYSLKAFRMFLLISIISLGLIVLANIVSTFGKKNIEGFKTEIND